MPKTKPKKTKKKLKDAARLRRELEKLMERAKSDYCEVRNSELGVPPIESFGGKLREK